MILGIGCDLLEIARLEKLVQKNYCDRVFTEEERRPSGDFSVKEAISKCFGTGVRNFSLLDIEVLRDELGKPYVKLYGGAEDIFRKMGGKSIHVSISNTKDLVMAYAVLEGKE